MAVTQFLFMLPVTDPSPLPSTLVCSKADGTNRLWSRERTFCRDFKDTISKGISELRGTSSSTNCGTVCFEHDFLFFFGHGGRLSPTGQQRYEASWPMKSEISNFTNKDDHPNNEYSTTQSTSYDNIKIKIKLIKTTPVIIKTLMILMKDSLLLKM